MHQETLNNLMPAIDEYLKSKTNMVVSLGVATAQVVAPSSGLDSQFDWDFMFRCIGAAYIAMQSAHLIYRFIMFLKSFFNKKTEV